MNTANKQLPNGRTALTKEERVRIFREVCKPIAKAFEPYVAGYRALLGKLRGEGFRVRWTCMVAPIQLDGD